MIQSQKRVVHTKAQKIQTPEGLKKFTEKIDVEKKVVFSAPIATKLSDTKQYFYEQYVYKWESAFKLIKFPASVNNIKECYWAQASVEYPRNKRTNANGELLERNERVNINEVTVLLVKDTDSESYLIVVSSYKPDVGRIDKLLGEEKIHELKTEEHIPNNFFVWLYYSYHKKEQVLRDLNLNNIVGFTGIIDDDTNKISGISSSTADLIITKAFVSNGDALKSLRLDLSDTILMTISALNEDRSLVMILPQTNLLLDGQSEDNGYYKIVKATSYIYAGLLPALLEQYFKKQKKFMQENKSFSKEIGIDVIQSIVKHNKIKFDEIDFDLG